MKKMMMLALAFLPLAIFSCQKELVEYESGDIKVSIEQGENWLHDFPLFLGIKKKNAPQVAVWIEKTDGTYLSSIYVTHKIATQSWIAAGGSTRKEALPHWLHARSAQGLPQPTKEQPLTIDAASGATSTGGEPLTDAISGATPTGSFDVKLKPGNGLPQQFVVKVEINQSTDFNNAFPKAAKEGDANYSGGEMGSGQPALVYAATVDLTSESKQYEAVLLGHSSPDGSDGAINTDLSGSGLTTALSIVKSIKITIQ